ncbi:PREDICTED: uncharacterized protein At3g60930, chloroplastic-like [Camelina sativa]|uniref:Uncharacterized protein At3g60930, chloroplastic-like n=1 Tax=Camelina sativa TaxID=90675 RepID=A0ABM1QR30_CAMSA|nr:PREDICTED: uncharacterized protein At3g60930, chloroplastic-like [Camelina sativa]
MSPPKSSSGKTAKPLIPGVYGPHQLSILSAENIAEIRGSTGIPPEIEIKFPEAHESPENPPPGYCCAFKIFFSACGLSFPLPELIVKMMFELGFALPQMCPNFVRIVVCLQTLGEEFNYKLSLADFLQVYTVKTCCTKGTLYVSPLSGLKVYDDLTEKDEKWRKSYFFFPLNELTFGHLLNHFERGLLCPTFAEFFSRFCSQEQIAWDSFSCERIRESSVRLRGRSLVCSDPISTSEMNYREERACRAAEKEAKLNMAAALAEGKARLPTKKSSSSVPEVDETPEFLDGPSEPLTNASGPSTSPTKSPVIVLVDSSDEPREIAAPPQSTRKSSGEVSSQRADSSKKRKEPETSSSSREKSRARTGSSGDDRSRSVLKDGGPSSERRSKEVPPLKEIGDSSGRLPSKEQRPSSRPPPTSPTDLMRSYTQPGVRIPAFADMSETNRVNFFCFTNKIGELFASPSSSEVCLLEERIADLEAEVKEYAKLEAENASTVAKAEQIRARMKKAEIKVLDLGVANEDLRDKLKKAGDLYFKAAEDAKAAKNRFHEIELRNQLLEAGNSCEIERVRREERQAMRRTLRPLVEEVKVTFEEREKLAPAKIRAAEIRANRMLIEEILRGEIRDMEAELGLLKADEEEADEKVSKVTPRDFDLSGFSDLLEDTPDLLCSEHPLSVTIDESGTNLGQMLNQGMDDFLANTKSVGELAEMGLALSKAASDRAPRTQ